MVTYVFIIGDRVRLSSDWRQEGVVNAMLPGNGSIEWYSVNWDDGTGDVYTRDQLVRI